MSGTALLFIDIVNHFDFPDGDELLKNALAIGPNLRELKRRARQAGVPTIYVNDNFGRWRSNFMEVLERCLDCGGDVKTFIEYALPDRDDYLVLKPKHSGFYYTPLELLLKNLGADRLILAGLATNSCVICTAHDANMRDLSLVVPADCCAARSCGEHDEAIRHLGGMLKADVTPIGDSGFQIGSAATPDEQANSGS
jgi:nicotinamidase-related amidase